MKGKHAVVAALLLGIGGACLGWYLSTTPERLLKRDWAYFDEHREALQDAADWAVDAVESGDASGFAMRLPRKWRGLSCGGKVYVHEWPEGEGTYVVEFLRTEGALLSGYRGFAYYYPGEALDLDAEVAEDFSEAVWLGGSWYRFLNY